MNAQPGTMSHLRRILVIVAAACLTVGLTAVVSGARWSHVRLSQSTGVVESMVDVWQADGDLVVAISSDGLTTDLRSCIDGRLVEFFGNARVERIGYGSRCVQWAGQHVYGYRDAAADLPVDQRTDLGGGVTRYRQGTGNRAVTYDVHASGLPVRAAFADGTVVSWRVVTGGPSTPPTQIAYKSWERYSAVGLPDVTAELGIARDPVPPKGYQLTDCFAYETDSGVRSLHVIWRDTDLQEVQVVASTGMPRQDVVEGITTTRDLVSSISTSGQWVIQLSAPDLETLRLMADALAVRLPSP